jgi:hypothetical protein
LALALLAAKPVLVKGKVPAGAVAMYVHGWHHQAQPQVGGDAVHNLIGFLTYLAGYEPEELFDEEANAFFTFKTEGFDIPDVISGFPAVVAPFELKVYYKDSANQNTWDPYQPANVYEDGQHIATFRTTPARILLGEGGGIIFSAELTDFSAFNFRWETCNFQRLFPGLTFSLSYTALSISQCQKGTEPEFTITELDGSAWAVGHPLADLGGP